MASAARRLPHNAPGDFFVDASCIDCDTCRWMAPEFFTQREEQASVERQPESAAEVLAAEQALLACPTGSIGTEAKHDLAAARASFPILLDSSRTGTEVYHLGYHADASFGATSYLVRRPPERSGNVMVDSPRWNRDLAERIEALGGVARLFLTHRDDVADHARWRERFGCERILHALEVRRGTRDVECVLEGTEPALLDDGLVAIPTPGHTEGSTCLLVEDTYLFTGDHLAFSHRRGHLIGFRSACWYSWEELVRSTARLREFTFEWVLPGHGRRFHAPREAMAAELERALAWMNGVS